ncbi:MAG: hypothetical protein WC677_07230 [Clostridia bacterium]|jgi:hypothetical protein
MDMLLYFKIFGFIFLIPGLFIAFFAKKIVKRFNLNEKTKCDFENEMSEDELKEYKFTKAVVNVKIIGMLIMLPGFIFVLFAFK